MSLPKPAPRTDIVVTFTPQALTDLGSALRVAGEAAGAPVEQLHPGVDDPALAASAVVRVAPEAAERTLARLLAVPVVAAAYAKPPAEPP